jgi:hypothetical protein
MSGAGEGYEQYADDYGYAGGWPTGEADADGPLDCTTAVLLRLADWLRSLVFQRTLSGQVFQFHDVLHEFPDEEQDLVAYPTASVILVGEPEDRVYSLTPTVIVERDSDGYTLFGTANRAFSLQVDAYCRDRSQRRDIDRVVDNEKSPLEGTRSLMLTLPKYHGLVARYNWLRTRRWDDDGERKRGEYRTTWWLEAVVPVVRSKVLPRMDARLYPAGQVIVGPEVDPSSP